MILSDRDIRAQIEAGRIEIEPFEPSADEPSCVDHHYARRFRAYGN